MYTYGGVDGSDAVADHVRGGHLFERRSHGVQQQLVLGQPLQRLHQQVGQLQSFAGLLRLAPLHAVHTKLSHLFSTQSLLVDL